YVAHVDLHSFPTRRSSDLDIVNGYIRGNFKYDQLKGIVENSLGSLYKNYSPNKIATNQFIEYNLDIQNKIVDLFVPKLEIADERSEEHTSELQSRENLVCR